VKTPNHQFSPSYAYNQITGGRDTGASIAEVLDLMKYQGSDTLNDFPASQTDASRQPTWAQKQRAGLFKIADWKTVTTNARGGAVNIRAIRQALSAGPVEVGLEISDQPGWKSTGDISLSKNYQGVSDGQHAVCLVGYDDRRWMEDGQGAFKFINSWGRNWGHQGYGWLSYKYAQKFIYEAMTIENTKHQSYDAGGSGAAKGVTLRFSPADGTGSAPVAVKTNENGRWWQTGFRVGESYLVTPSKPGFSFSPKTVKVSVDDLNRWKYNFKVVKKAQAA
jgi:hypothetical protein